LFVLLSMVNFFPMGPVTNEDDLQLFEEWRANKARIDAEAARTEQERREKNEVFKDFDFEAELEEMRRVENATKGDGAAQSATELGAKRVPKGKRKRPGSLRHDQDDEFYDEETAREREALDVEASEEQPPT